LHASIVFQQLAMKFGANRNTACQIQLAVIILVPLWQVKTMRVKIVDLSMQSIEYDLLHN
jgi:hypothetical protein